VHVHRSAHVAELAQASAVPLAQLAGKIIVKPSTSPPAPVSASDVQTRSPEGPMFRDGLRFALSLLLFALSLPLLAISFLIAALCTGVVAIVPGFLKRKDQDTIALQMLRAVEEFEFEEAMSAYEALIAAHVWRQP
jgi:hypothetical protein